MLGRNVDMIEDADFFSEERSVDAVNGRMGPHADARVREIVATIVRHMHVAIKEMKLTQEEWAAGIRFLTETGQMCTAWRQEYILLSDVLGVSMLVDAINHHRPTGATENTVLGPFHVAGAPEYPNGANINLDGKGETAIVTGRVLDTLGRPVAGARLDVWQTSDDGFYDVQKPGEQPAFNHRGIFHSDEDGKYWFKTVKPRFYPIPDDGPVGKLLSALDRHPNRAAHLHFIVTADGFETVVTHIFDPDCPYLSEDAVFGVKQSLVANFVKVEDPAASEGQGLDWPFWKVEWDFALTPVARD